MRARTLTQMPSDPLSLWNGDEAKEGILRFVLATTTEGGPDYVAPVNRVAVFDNDSTLGVSPS